MSPSIRGNAPLTSLAWVISSSMSLPMLAQVLAVRVAAAALPAGQHARQAADVRTLLTGRDRADEGPPDQCVPQVARAPVERFFQPTPTEPTVSGSADSVTSRTARSQVPPAMTVSPQAVYG